MLTVPLLVAVVGTGLQWALPRWLDASRCCPWADGCLKYGSIRVESLEEFTASVPPYTEVASCSDCSERFF